MAKRKRKLGRTPEPFLPVECKEEHYMTKSGKKLCPSFVKEQNNFKLLFLIQILSIQLILYLQFYVFFCFCFGKWCLKFWRLPLRRYPNMPYQLEI